MTETAPQTNQSPEKPEAPRDHHVCPIWIGRLLVSPLRRLVEDPMQILGPLVTPGSTVIDVGCAMGFHSLDLARLVGHDGRVICLDIQQKMLDGLVKRARRKGLEGIIDPRLSSEESLGLGDVAGRAELVTAYNVVHETPYPKRFLRECAETLKPGGRFLIVEPRGHVTTTDFAQTTALVRSLDLEIATGPAIWNSHTAVFIKP